MFYLDELATSDTGHRLQLYRTCNFVLENIYCSSFVGIDYTLLRELPYWLLLLFQKFGLQIRNLK